MLKIIRRESFREIIICLALEFELSYEKTQVILQRFKEPKLYARNRRDTIIIWALYHKKNIKEVNQLCAKYGCNPVGRFSKRTEIKFARFIKRIVNEAD